LLLLLLCRAGLLASTYLEVQEVQQLKETYDEALVRQQAAAMQRACDVFRGGPVVGVLTLLHIRQDGD
jgi:hypothetical protein